VLHLRVHLIAGRQGRLLCYMELLRPCCGDGGRGLAAASKPAQPVEARLDLSTRYRHTTPGSRPGLAPATCHSCHNCYYRRTRPKHPVMRAVVHGHAVTLGSSTHPTARRRGEIVGDGTGWVSAGLRQQRQVHRWRGASLGLQHRRSTHVIARRGQLVPPPSDVNDDRRCRRTRSLPPETVPRLPAKTGAMIGRKRRATRRRHEGTPRTGLKLGMMLRSRTVRYLLLHIMTTPPAGPARANTAARPRAASGTGPSGHVSGRTDLAP
jgi:hypothetical protein